MKRYIRSSEDHAFKMSSVSLSKLKVYVYDNYVSKLQQRPDTRYMFERRNLQKFVTSDGTRVNVYHLPIRYYVANDIDSIIIMNIWLGVTSEGICYFECKYGENGRICLNDGIITKNTNVVTDIDEERIEDEAPVGYTLQDVFKYVRFSDVKEEIDYLLETYHIP